MVSSYSSNPPAAYKSANGQKWVDRELQRLDRCKTDKSRCEPTVSGIYSKLKDMGREIHDLKQELDADITGVHDVASEACSKATNLICPNEQRVTTMEKTVRLWSSWIVRGLAAIIILLLTAGGGWVYSYVRLESTAKTAAKTANEAVNSFEQKVEAVRAEQRKQQDTLQRIEQDNGTQSEDLKEALKKALVDVLNKPNDNS